MSNYVLFIGGTGARVYRSFLHICAAGVVQKERINALLLDADSANQAAKVCRTLYQSYRHHHQHLQSGDTCAIEKTPAFHCDIQMPTVEAISPVQDKVTCLGHIAKEDATRKRAMNWFYSSKEQGQDLKNGFYARPNIGCIFFQNFKNGEMQQFLEKIQSDLKSEEETVKVVLVGSVFGGTGASGLPSIMKLISASCGKFGDKLHCGGVLVTPYFEVPPPDEEERKRNLVIDSKEFYRNTYAALEYYEEHGAFERTYLVGKDKLDPVNWRYVNGGPEQDNKSHVVEVCAAMAVKDFLEVDRAPGTWGHIIHEESVTWMTLGEELYPVADLTRMQVVLKGAVYPYIKSASRQKAAWHSRNQWYHVYKAGSESAENMARMEEYTTEFLNWMYDIQTAYSANEQVLDNSVQLCGTLVSELAGSLQLGRAKGAQDQDEKSALGKFNDLIDTASNIEYVFDKIILILSCLGVVDTKLAGLGCFGLLIKLFKLVGQKKNGQTDD